MCSTREEIADAALVCVAREGFGVSLRAVAAEAGVSPGLVVHYFGSKQGLFDALEDTVLGVAEGKMRAMDAGGPGAAIAFVGSLMEDGRIPRYLARVLTEGGDRGKRLFASLVDVTEKSMDGLPLSEPRVTAALLVVHALGVMVMTDHIGEATGVALQPGKGIERILDAALDIYGGKVAPLLPT